MRALPPLGKRGICSEDNTTGLRIQLSQSLTLSELWGFPGGTNSKSAMQIAIRSLVEEDPQGKGMAIHCSVLAWEISWTEETGRLQSTGWERVGRDLATKQQPPPQLLSGVVR